MIDQGKKNVVGVMVDAVDYQAAVARIVAAARHRRAFSVSALAVHGIMTGVQSDAHKYRLNSLDLVVPDGQPVRWALNVLHGTRLPDRVYGTELTLRTLAAAERERLPVFFYGTTAPLLARVVLRARQQFPALIVSGTEPSKFRKLELSERIDLAEKIRNSGAALVFVALGCPRQEVFVFEMREWLPMPVLAVGAAFAFIAGDLQRAPGFMQRNGLEWLFRLLQEPRRLWCRYLLLNPYYLFLLAGQLVGMRFSPSGSKPLVDLRYG